LAASPSSAASAARFSNHEKMEGQLCPWWEINKENLGKTKRVLALRQTLKEKPEVGSVLNLMDKVLDYMVKNEDKIRQPLVKFLMDSKETLKLLMRKEADSELNTYKQLAYMGIQARYSCLEELKEAKPERPALGFKEEIERSGIFVKMENQIGEVSKKMNLFYEKMGELYQNMELFLLKVDRGSMQPAEPPIRSVWSLLILRFSKWSKDCWVWTVTRYTNCSKFQRIIRIGMLINRRFG
jgi:hypothetical protein